MAEFPHRTAIHSLDQIRRSDNEYRWHGKKRQRQQYLLWVHLDDVLIADLTSRFLRRRYGSMSLCPARQRDAEDYYPFGFRLGGAAARGRATTATSRCRSERTRRARLVGRKDLRRRSVK